MAEATGENITTAPPAVGTSPVDGAAGEQHNEQSAGGSEPALEERPRIPWDRFQEVNTRKKAAETEAAQLRNELQSVKQMLAQMQPQQVDVGKSLAEFFQSQQEQPWVDPAVTAAQEARTLAETTAAQYAELKAEMERQRHEVATERMRTMLETQFAAAEAKYPHASRDVVISILQRAPNATVEDAFKTSQDLILQHARRAMAMGAVGTPMQPQPGAATHVPAGTSPGFAPTQQQPRNMTEALEMALKLT